MLCVACSFRGGVGCRDSEILCWANRRTVQEVRDASNHLLFASLRRAFKISEEVISVWVCGLWFRVQGLGMGLGFGVWGFAWEVISVWVLGSSKGLDLGFGV